MAFTTYADLVQSMLDALADGDPLTKSYEIPGPAGSRRHEYRTLKEFTDALAVFRALAAEEAAPAAVSRTYAKPMRRY